MIKNYFFLFAGILAFLGAVGHAIVGHQSFLVAIESIEIWHAGFLFLHQTTWFMLVSSSVLVAVSFFSRASSMKAIGWFIVTIFVGNFLVYVVSSLIMNRIVLAQLVPQLAFVVLYTGLIVAGIRSTIDKPN